MPFDREACPVDQRLIDQADPSHLIILEIAAAAFRDAGYDGARLAGRNVGVYVGQSRGSTLVADLICATRAEDLSAIVQGIGEFGSWSADRRARVAPALAERLRAALPSRSAAFNPNLTAQAAPQLIAKAFGLRGPALALDAACASGLYTVAAAVAALRAGRIEMALAGAASFNSWMSLVLFSQAQALTANGSFPFDERADGFVSSDGYGALVLKPADQARADGDQILAVIRGIGLATDGHGRSLWAPRQEGQIAAMQRAYADPGLRERVQYIEAHGTSTQLGDATEIASVTQVFGDQVADRRIPLASVKGNIGHTCETAGIAGLIKTVLALRHGVIPPAVNFVQPSRQIDWDKAPIRIPTAPEPWAGGGDQPRLAAINSFGIGGLNAHVVIEEPTEGTPPRTSSRPRPTVPADSSGKLAIVGMGGVFPGAFTVDAFARAIRDGAAQTAAIPRERWDPNRYLGAGPFRSPTAVTGALQGYAYDWRRHKVPPRQIETGDPLRFMLLDAADQALVAAGLKSATFDRSRTAVIVGTMLASDFYSDLSFALRLPEFERELRKLMSEMGCDDGDIDDVVAEFHAAFVARNQTLRDESGGFSSSTLASAIAKTFDLMGGAVTVDGAEASSLAALTVARDLLTDGSCDAVLCAGAQRYLGIDSHEWYGLRGVLAHDKASTEGLHLGEGVGAVVLKRLDDARRAGDPILAVIDDIACGASPAGPAEAIRDAVGRSLAGRSDDDPPVRLRPVAAGAATLDAAERSAFEGSRSAATAIEDAAQPLPPARQFGFALGASGMASLIAGALELKTTSSTGVLSYAFDGPAYHAVLSHPQPTRPAAHAAPANAFRIYRLSGGSPADLAEQARALGQSGQAEARLRDSSYGGEHAWRLAIVADSGLALTEKLLLAARALDQQGAAAVLEEQGIYVGQAGERPRVAFAFAGQGSQYHGMLAALVAESPAAATRMDEFDAILVRLGHPPLREIFGLADETLASDVWATQMSLLGAEVVLHAAVGALGIKADVVCGHSFGEYAALTAAGAWTLEQAIRITDARARFILADPGQGGVFLATNAEPRHIEPLLPQLSGFACVAIRNTPDRTVVGGEAAAIAELRQQLEAAGFSSSMLPVPRAFHTPLMAAVSEPMRAFLQAEPIHPPAIPLVSSVTARFVADPEDIRDNLVRQLTQPMVYFDLVERLVADRVTAVVEIGPRQVLTGLHRRLLPADGSTFAIATDNVKRPGLQQLLRVRARLECAGLDAPERAVREARPASAESSPEATAAVTRHPIRRFDATERRRRRSTEDARAPEAPRAAEDEGADPWRDFLVTFICDNTGYPRDLVDIDADLEADLGIDSLKKAQLFGELQEQFGLALPTGGKLSLNDYPTLRHVLTLLRESQPEPGPRQTAVAAAPPPPRPVPVPAAPGPDLPILIVAGSPRDIGRSHGRQHADLLKPLLDNVAVLSARDLPSNADPEAYFTADGIEELAGMAEALNRPVDDLIALNLAIVRYSVRAAGAERLEPVACTQLAIAASRNGGAPLLHAANEDWPMAMQFNNNLTRIVQVRRQTGTVPHLLFGIPGQLGGVNGLNAEGLAITSASLLNGTADGAIDAPGIFHPQLVMRMLAQATDPREAVDILRTHDRMGAWSVCISHGRSDTILQVEYNEQAIEVVEQNLVRTTNHASLLEANGNAPEHSRLRFARLVELLGGDEPIAWSMEQIRKALRDTYDLGRERYVRHPTLNTIKRQDNQTSIVIEPGRLQVWATPGPRTTDPDAFIQIDAAKLLRDDATPTAAPDGRTMARWVLRPRPAPLADAAGRQPSWHGAVLVHGRGAMADALRRRIAEGGGHVVELADDLPDASLGDALAALHATTPIAHMFLVAAGDADTDGGDWASARRRATLRPYLLCQRWFGLVQAAGQEAQTTLLALTTLGGDFGLAGSSAHVAGGALAGLLKSVRREAPAMLVKLVDLAVDESPDTGARLALDELAAATAQLEVGYLRGQRRIMKAVPRRAPVAAGVDIEPGGVWVVSGGARGITSLVAKELGLRYGLRLHLLGRTSLESPADDGAGGRRPDRAAEVRRLLDDLEALGVSATYHCCDVADPSACAEVLRLVRERSGPIDGVIHGAGIEQAASFGRKRLESVDATLAAKNDGAANLMALTEPDPLRWFIAFGSISGRFGGLGQTDYGLASDMLAKQVLRYRAERPACRSVVIDWPAWDETGMSVRPETRVALNAVGFAFMSSSEGIEHLVDEIRSGAADGEVMILDEARGIDLDGSMWDAVQRGAAAAMAADVTASPLVEGLGDVDVARRALVAEVRFDPASDPFLTDHRFEGEPLMPAVVGMEALAEAARLQLASTAPVELSDVEILAPLRPRASAAVAARVAPSGDPGSLSCELEGEFRNRRGKLMQCDRVFMRARCATLSVAPDMDDIWRDEPPDDGTWLTWTYPDAQTALQRRVVAHGPALQALRSLHIGESGGWAKIIAPSPAAVGGARTGTWALPAAVLDACLVACAVHAKAQADRDQLPVGFGTVRCWALPAAEETCTLAFRLVQITPHTTSYDFALRARDGRTLLEVRDHRAAVVTAPAT